MSQKSVIGGPFWEPKPHRHGCVRESQQIP